MAAASVSRDAGGLAQRRGGRTRRGRRFYLTELLSQPDLDGGYGPFAVGLSAFSPTLSGFAGGPGQLGLHGTDQPHLVGTDVSHGCLRVTNPVIVHLAHVLPLGTPVEITH